MLEVRRGQPDRVQIFHTRDARRRQDRVLQLSRSELRVLDPFRRLRQAELEEAGPKLTQLPSARAFLGQLAHRGDRHCLAHERPVGDGPLLVVKSEPALFVTSPKRAEVHPCGAPGLSGNHAFELFPLSRMARRSLRRGRDLVLEAHSGNNSPVSESLSERNRAAQELFAPLGETYDRYARLLSFGQDPRWRSFLVSRTSAVETGSVLDVACGTAAVAIETVRRYGCRVVGIDQSEDMLAAGRVRVEAAGLDSRIALQEGRAESLPFEDASFDAVTFTYLLRYVDDPAETMRELARVVRPGGTIAMLDFFVPRGLARPAWEAYVRAGLPVLGRAISPGWGEVGSFLGPSIRDFWNRHPVESVVRYWEAAGIDEVRGRRLSLGGGLVLWGTRGA